MDTAVFGHDSSVPGMSLLERCDRRVTEDTRESLHYDGLFGWILSPVAGSFPLIGKAPDGKMAERSCRHTMQTRRGSDERVLAGRLTRETA
jgi:hypothetical protein